MTAYVARAAFPDGNPYMSVRDTLGTFYDDECFAALFPDRGQPAETPWRLALITVLQYAEGLADRQAAEAVRSRIDWKYALGLELTDPGFDFSVLCQFRARLTDTQYGRCRRLIGVASCADGLDVRVFQFLQGFDEPGMARVEHVIVRQDTAVDPSTLEEERFQG